MFRNLQSYYLPAVKMSTELSSRKMPLISALQGMEIATLQQTPIEEDDSEPPLTETLITLLQNSMDNPKNIELYDHGIAGMTSSPEMELPLIDISRLWSSDQAGRESCIKEIANTAKEWGFFQITNHGIGEEVFENMKMEQEKVFRQPFRNKVEQGFAGNNHKLFNGGSYRWGNPRATCLKQLAWSEAIHVAVSDITGISNDTLRSAIESFGKGMYILAETLAEVLADGLGVKSDYFKGNCPPSSCYLRMNRYPSCPFASNVFGLMPHTDSDFLTILSQDKIGGLQLMKDDGCWINVRPNPNALVVNVGDLFQAWSNGVYKSVKHRVVASKGEARLSTAFFYCPKGEAVIGSCSKTSPPLYTHFSFHEYRLQVYKDVQATGDKVGLSRFLL